MASAKQQRFDAMWKLLLVEASGASEVGMHLHEICFRLWKSKDSTERDLFEARVGQFTPWETLSRDFNKTPSSSKLFSRTAGGKQWKLSKPTGSSRVFISVNGKQPTKSAIPKGADAGVYIKNGLTLRALHKKKTPPAPANPSPRPIIVAVTLSPWEKLSDFAVKHEWSSHRLARLSCNVIIEGVPGTGKTHALKDLANTIENIDTIAAGRFATVMHPATSYEDFVEGLRPGNPAAYLGARELSDTELRDAIVLAPGKNLGLGQVSHWFFDSPAAIAGGFAVHDGFFVAACAEAVRNPSTPYVVLLDELNRCNIPKVMGDLITTMEVSKRAKWNESDKRWDLSFAQVMTLPYSKRQFFVPDNITLIGTMNTTDRSVAPMDAALRRRFVFVRMEPKFPEYDVGTPLAAARSRVVALNTALNKYLGADAMLGHSYFYDMEREISAGGDAAEVTQFYFDKVIFPMVVDTLANNGCLAELYEASLLKRDASSTKPASPAETFLNVLKSMAEEKFSGRGMTQTLRLEWRVTASPLQPDVQEKIDDSPAAAAVASESANADGAA
jgi:hypothetical protein